MSATRPLGALTGTGADANAAQAMVAGGAVTTSAPSYTTATVNALSLDTAGNLRTVAGAGTAEIGKVAFDHISVAGTAMTRPANTTAYSANDSISDNATAGSVTANVVTLSDTNDDPVNLTEILLASTDTGLGGATVRIHLFNSNPTSSSGVVGGDNAAWSNKQAGWVGSMSGVMTAFSDGSRGRLVPDAGSNIIIDPVSGGRTLYWQVQALTGFTPSGNSTTLTPTFKGYQGRR